MGDYTIILADDHALMRSGLRQLIEGQAGLSVIGEAGDGLTLLKLVTRLVPDMVIIDIAMPGLMGVDAAREIHAARPGIDILMLSMHKREDYLSMSLAAGAKGYLLKEDSVEELLQAIQRIRKGGTYLSLNLAIDFHSGIIDLVSGEGRNFDGDHLTPRERQVLKLIAEGHTDRQIGLHLCISIRTVNRHHANIREKLGVRRTADLVRYAMARGYLNHQS